MVGVSGALVVRFALLTASLLRWQQGRGEPVYRRLPDGRLRFEWPVGRAYSPDVPSHPEPTRLRLIPRAIGHHATW